MGCQSDYVDDPELTYRERLAALAPGADFDF